MQTGWAVALAVLLVALAPAASAGDEGGDADLVGPLRGAHMARDEKAVEREEQALIARGRDILEKVHEAYLAEKQFNVKVSLQYVKLAIEGKASARAIIAAMRATQDPSEKMRLAFMLAKLRGPDDARAIEEMIPGERDSMIRKHLIRTGSSLEGRAGLLRMLMSIARSDPDRSHRIEAIRALEEKATREPTLAPDVSSFFTEFCESESDVSIRSIAIRGLANIAGREAMPFFRRVLESDERTNNRAEAAKYVERVGTEEDLAFLQSVYERERVYYIKQKIKQAMAAIYRRAGKEPPVEPGGPPVLPPDDPHPQPSVDGLRVAAIAWAEARSQRSVFLVAPRSREPISFRIGNDLGSRAGFESFGGVVVKDITPSSVILVDRAGKALEVRIPGPVPDPPSRRRAPRLY